MKIDKYTEQSGLMPRNEWEKLIKINTSLLEACKLYIKHHDSTETNLEMKEWLDMYGIPNMRHAIKQAENK